MAAFAIDGLKSTRTPQASPPLSLIEEAVCSAPAPSISPITTRAPRRAKATAVARPMPAAPPVTTTTFPVMRSDISEFPFDGADLLREDDRENNSAHSWMAGAMEHQATLL